MVLPRYPRRTTDPSPDKGPEPDGPNQDVKASVLRYLFEIGGFEKVALRDGAQFDGELLMKSIDFVELQVALEEEWDVEIDPIRVIELNRLDRVVEYLSELVEEKEQSGF